MFKQKYVHMSYKLTDKHTVKMLSSERCSSDELWGQVDNTWSSGPGVGLRQRLSGEPRINFNPVSGHTKQKLGEL